MKRGPAGTFIRDIDILHQVGTIGGLTDRDLLGHFTARDSVAAQQAFEAIVHRHGPMVLGVWRHILRDAHTAEDAFQVTFLVLALKADTIRKRNSLGPWLHGVATRISRRARALSRRRREQPLAPASVAFCAAEESEIDAAELRAVLDEEVDRLPAAYQVNLDPQRLRGLRTDADGRVIMVSLIPGARYRFRGHDFTAEAGKTIDLPDVTISRP